MKPAFEDIIKKAMYDFHKAYSLDGLTASEVECFEAGFRAGWMLCEVEEI